MIQPQERVLSFRERLTADVSELVKREPPNDWFTVTRVDKAGNVKVNVSERFLGMAGHRMDLCWKAWNSETQRLTSGQIPGFLADFVRGNLDWYCTQIVGISGFAPEQILKKINYLQENDGIDFFGRRLPQSQG